MLHLLRDMFGHVAVLMKEEIDPLKRCETSYIKGT